MCHLKLFLPSLVFHLCMALQCYTGRKIIGSAPKKVCERASDFCYNMTLDLAKFPEVIKAGCSAVGCRLSRNKCIKKKLHEHQVTFCCCNNFDLCNSKFTYLNKREKAKQGAKDLGKIGKMIGKNVGNIGMTIGKDLGKIGVAIGKKIGKKIINKGTGKPQH